MRTKEFHVVAEELEKMIPHQRGLLAERLRKIGHTQAINILVESRALAKPVCPKCGHDQLTVYTMGSRPDALLPTW